MLLHLPKDKLKKYVDEFCHLEGYTGTQHAMSSSLLIIMSYSDSLAKNNPEVYELYDKFSTWMRTVRNSAIQDVLNSGEE